MLDPDSDWLAMIRRERRCIQLTHTVLHCHKFFWYLAMNLHEMRYLDTFTIAVNETGHEFVTHNLDELDKNHRQDDSGQAKKRRMYGLTTSQKGKLKSNNYFQSCDQMYASRNKMLFPMGFPIWGNLFTQIELFWENRPVDFHQTTHVFHIHWGVYGVFLKSLKNPFLKFLFCRTRHDGLHRCV